MRRLARRLLTLCTALSLVLCVAACALWAGSYWVLGQWGYSDGGDVDRGTELKLDGALGRGKVLFQYQRSTWDRDAVVNGFTRREGPGAPRGFQRWFHRVRGGEWSPAFSGLRALWFNFATELERSSTDASSAFLLPKGQRRSVTRRVKLGFPLWAVVMATAPLPAWRLLRAQVRRNRRRRQQCVNCGYDLRASSGRCPECGTARRQRMRLPAAPPGLPARTPAA